MEVQEQENLQPTQKTVEELAAPPRQPLQNVINCAQSGIPLPTNRCRIPGPQKTSRISGLKPPTSYATTNLPKKMSHRDPRQDRAKLSGRSCNCVDKLKAEGKMVIDHEEYETLKHDVHVTKRGLLLMERLNETTAEELVQAKSESKSLTADLVTVQQENSRLLSESEEVDLLLSKYAGVKPPGLSLLQFLEQRLQVDTDRTNQLKQRERELKEQEESLYSQLQSLISQQETTIQKQKGSLLYRQNQLEEQKARIMELLMKVDQLEGVKEAMEFLEAEHSMVMEERASLKESNETVLLRLTTCEQELEDCRACLGEREAKCRSLENRVQELSQQLSQKSAELDSVQTVGRELVHSQAKQIRDCGQVVSRLTRELTGLLRSLLSTTGTKVSSTVLRDFGKTSDYPWMHSLVASVLQTLGEEEQLDTCDLSDNRQTDDGKSHSEKQDVQTSRDNVDNELKASEETTPGDSSLENQCVHRQNSPGRSSSAFQPVKGTKDSCWSCVIPNGPITDYSSSSSTSSHTDRAKVMLGVSDLPETKSLANLPDESSHLSAVVSEISRINFFLEQSAFHAIEDLRKKSDNLNDELEKAMRKSNDKDKELESLQAEVQQEKSRLQEVTSEKDILASQQDALVKKLETLTISKEPSDSMTAAETRFYRQTLQLKKEVYVLQDQLSHKTEELDQLTEKATRRMKVLADNWSKADDEVKELDKMLEAVRKALHKNKPVFKNCEALKSLLKELDGVSDDGIMSVKKPLDTVRTSKW